MIIFWFCNVAILFSDYSSSSPFHETDFRHRLFLISYFLLFDSDFVLYLIWYPLSKGLGLEVAREARMEFLLALCLLALSRRAKRAGSFLTCGERSEPHVKNDPLPPSQMKNKIGVVDKFPAEKRLWKINLKFPAEKEHRKNSIKFGAKKNIEKFTPAENIEKIFNIGWKRT